MRELDMTHCGWIHRFEFSEVVMNTTFNSPSRVQEAIGEIGRIYNSVNSPSADSAGAALFWMGKFKKVKGPLDEKFHLARLSVPRTQIEFCVSAQTSDVCASLYSQKGWAPCLDCFIMNSGTSWSRPRRGGVIAWSCSHWGLYKWVD